MAWERIHEAGADEANNPYNVWRYAVPGGWIYVHCNFGVVGTVFVPEPSKVTAENRTDYQRGWDDGYKVTAEDRDAVYDGIFKDGYDAAIADEKAKIDEIILSLRNVIDLIDEDEKSYAQSHITGIINALRSET